MNENTGIIKIYINDIQVVIEGSLDFVVDVDEEINFFKILVRGLSFYPQVRSVVKITNTVDNVESQIFEGLITQTEKSGTINNQQTYSIEVGTYKVIATYQIATLSTAPELSASEIVSQLVLKSGDEASGLSG
jgi:hypothetical protein